MEANSSGNFVCVFPGFLENIENHSHLILRFAPSCNAYRCGKVLIVGSSMGCSLQPIDHFFASHWFATSHALFHDAAGHACRCGGHPFRKPTWQGAVASCHTLKKTSITWRRSMVCCCVATAHCSAAAQSTPTPRRRKSPGCSSRSCACGRSASSATAPWPGSARTASGCWRPSPTGPRWHWHRTPIPAPLPMPSGSNTACAALTW